ncbi:hypothetical protein [Absidia glauca]|uniref:LSM2-LSM8 complex subunit LSM8 n=1 Tax=Absidia glauca TaxID=4829 RepID=A0A168NTR2_ABSGL|nr:hypothetical protein [Absidia glauca]
MSLLQPYVDQSVLILTLDGRILVVRNPNPHSDFAALLLLGTLRGTDQTSNVILEKCQERVFSATGTEENPLGLYLIRGDNICTVGLLDTEKEEEMDITQIKAEPLGPLTL